MKHLQSIEFVFINTCLLNTVLLHLSLPQKQHIMPDTLTFTSVHTIPRHPRLSSLHLQDIRSL